MLRTEIGFRENIALFNFSCQHPVNIISDPDSVKEAINLLQKQNEPIMMVMVEYAQINKLASPFIVLVHSGYRPPQSAKLLSRVGNNAFYLC
jgi:hypothetical protein